MNSKKLPVNNFYILILKNVSNLNINIQLSYRDFNYILIIKIKVYYVIW
jgi:hypothetical protein